MSYMISGSSGHEGHIRPFRGHHQVRWSLLNPLFFGEYLWFIFWFPYFGGYDPHIFTAGIANASWCLQPLTKELSRYSFAFHKVVATNG
jgi:hypothetical protein